CSGARRMAQRSCHSSARRRGFGIWDLGFGGRRGVGCWVLGG
ncbi:MAG: hypothetical protein AVDCRST_MAG93-3963, partial [uncultured Chloroflexia bacterium]